MSFMEKFQSQIERFLVPLASKLNSQRHICAVRDAFILTFPLTMAGSLMVLINSVFLSPDGFVCKMLRLQKIFPNIAEYQAIFSPVLKGSTDILAILVTFLIARNLAKQLKSDDLLSGLTAVSVYFIIYPDYVNVDGVNHLGTKFFGPQGLFVAIIVGLLVAELMAALSKSTKLEIKMPEQVPPAVSQSFNLLLPIMIVLAVTGVLNFIFNNITSDGIQVLIYNMIQAPLTSLGSSMGTIIVFVVVQQFLWVLGIHGPNTLNALRSVIFTEQQNMNLAYVAAHGTAWGAPYPINWGSINDAFGNTGGSGATLGLIIATFIVGKKNKAQYQICKMSLAPGLFNINEPIIFGLPLVMNPMYIVPFILSPVVCNIIGWFCVCVIKIIPPVAYSVAWTTPGFLIPFLGSGANNIMALVIGFVCVGVSTLIYLPFVIASTKAALKAEGAENA